MNSTAAVVVTYNRCQMLKENIFALLNQSLPCDILIIDNASTDETTSIVNSFKDSRIKYLNTGSNLGGAGGFAYGTRKALESGYDYFWLMDDDSVPNKSAHEELVLVAAGLRNDFSYLASIVYWTDGSLFPMNMPTLKYSNYKDAKLDYASKYSILPIKSSSFVGCFVNSKVAYEAGIPISEFFIYGDDVEYTMRLEKCASAYLVLRSNIIHKAPSATGTDVIKCDYQRLPRYYYHYRNRFFIARRDGLKSIFFRLGSVSKSIMLILLKSKNYKIKRMAIVLKGTLAGVLFKPEIIYVEKK